MASPAECIFIRDCVESDLVSVQRIYAHYVETAVCTYEEDVPSIDEMRRRWALIKGKNMPVIIKNTTSLDLRHHLNL